MRVVQMTEKLERQSIFLPGEPDEKRYFEALLEIAVKRGAVSQDFFDSVVLSLLELLALRCKNYSGVENSSVRTETAQELLQSAVFTIGIRLKELDTPEAALEELEKTPLEEIYKAGYGKLQAMIKSTRRFYAAVCRNSIRTENYFYNSTLFGGIRGFFKLYNPDFAAHSLCITADYQTMCYPQGYRGIEFIRKYLTDFFYENIFCLAFDAQAVKKALTLYAVNYCDTVRDGAFNLFEVVFSAALACAVGGESITALIPSENAKRLVREGLAVDDGEALKIGAAAVVEQLSEISNVSESLAAYIRAAAERNLPSIRKTVLILSDYFD